MSMNSDFVANLHLMATLIREYEYAEISRMLREAADTIEMLQHKLQSATAESDARYDAGFRNGVQAVFQQLESIECYDDLQGFIAEYWGEGEGNDEL